MGEVKLLRPLRTFSPIEWHGRTAPSRDWLIEGVALRKTVCLFSGPGETGKSMLMQQLMTACAIGQPWLGMDVPRIRSFGIFAEDPQDEIWRRQEGISDHYQISHGDLEDMEMVSIDEVDDPCLYRPSKDAPAGRPTLLWSQITTHIHDTGVQLLVVDNVGAVFEANENYKEHVRPFIGMLIKLAREMNGCVLLVQHPGQAGELDGSAQSGSRSWRNSVRSQMILSRVPDEDKDNPSDERLLRFGKANYGRRRGGMRIEWRDGLFQPCTIADQRGGRLSQLDRIELRARLERALTTSIRAGEKFSMAKQSHVNVASVLLKDKSWGQFSWKEIMDECEAMLKEGKFNLVTIGPPSRLQILIRPASILYPGEPV